METLTICRFCLDAHVQHVVKDLQLQEIYERLTRIPFQSDMRPLAVCYICYAQLRASLRFKLKCLRAEQLLAQMLDQRPALNPTQIDRSAFNQLSLSSTQLTVIESTVHGVRTSDTNKPNTYECYVKLEEQTIADLTDTGRTTHSKPDSEQNPSDLEDNVPLNYVKELRETKETRDTEQQQDRWMTVCPNKEECESNAVLNYKQDMINVTNTDEVKLESSECNYERSERDLIGHDTCLQNVCKSHPNNIKQNDNAINDSLIGAKTCLSSEKRFFCDKCMNSFGKKSELVQHIMSNCKKSHMCPVCNKGYTEKRNLKTHARSHTVEKPYVCNVCQKGFTRKASMKIHKLIHTGEKPHVCNVCQKGFIRKAHLKRHKLTHTGEKLHVCNVCQKCFIQKAYLKNHELTHTVCPKTEECGSNPVVNYKRDIINVTNTGGVKQDTSDMFACFLFNAVSDDDIENSKIKQEASEHNYDIEIDKIKQEASEHNDDIENDKFKQEASEHNYDIENDKIKQEASEHNYVIEIDKIKQEASEHNDDMENDKIKQEASEHNYDIENDKIQFPGSFIPRDLKDRNLCRKNIAARCYYNKKKIKFQD